MNVSVIVINKNREKYIKDSILSITCQLDKNDQLIVIDDNSDDNSIGEIQKLKGYIDLIINFNSNGNRAKVRNEAVRHVSNEVIIFIDSDVIIGPDNINKVKKYHELNNVIAVVGNIAGNLYDQEQFSLICRQSVDEFIAKINNNFRYLYNYKFLFDDRYNNEKRTSDIRSNWINYYTTFSSVCKNVFHKVGGFDENFTTWGTEDIEFGYRINQEGGIFFANDIVSFHCPHDKNIFMNAINNIVNLYYFLKKFQTFEVEVYCSFISSDIGATKKNLLMMYEYIKQYNTKKVELPLDKNELAVYFPSHNHPTGLIIYNDNGNIKEINLFGFAIPLADESISTIYISEYWKLLPIPILCMVVQECLRISKTVFLKKTSQNHKPFQCIDSINNNNFMYDGIFYISQYLVDFMIIDYSQDFLKVEWKKQANMYLTKKIEHIR